MKPYQFAYVVCPIDRRVAFELWTDGTSSGQEVAGNDERESIDTYWSRDSEVDRLLGSIGHGSWCVEHRHDVVALPHRVQLANDKVVAQIVRGNTPVKPVRIQGRMRSPQR
jgi:hypothetical protein